MRRPILFGFSVTLALLIGACGGWIVASQRSTDQLSHIVALSWGDGIYGPAFYGAHVYLEPQDSGYRVMARVYIGRSSNFVQYFHDCGELGKVKTDAEAVARWGKIDWRKDGLHIGSGQHHYFLPRTQLENHR